MVSNLSHREEFSSSNFTQKTSNTKANEAISKPVISINCTVPKVQKFLFASDTFLKSDVFFGLSILDSLDPKLCLFDKERVLGAMKNKGKGSSLRDHVYCVLNQAFNDAVEYYGYLEKNPVKKQDKPKKHKTEKIYLKPHEAFKLLKHCKDHYIGPAVHLGILAGLRLSEIQALTWENVDFERNQILICKAYKSKTNKEESHPKQKDWLIIPMPEMLSNFLKERKNKFPLSFVAPAFMGGMLFGDKFRKHLTRFCKEVGAPRVTPHGLRHSCTEVWFSHGASLEDVRRLLGHKSARTTQTYVHRTDERLTSLASKIKHV